MTSRWRFYRERIAASIQYHGVAFAALWLLLSAVGLVKSKWFVAYRHKHFDRRYGVETTDALPCSALGVESEQLALANHYEPCVPEAVANLISSAPVRHEDCVFVDFGSGKGRALLVASLFAFQRIVGVEWSRRLMDVAEENVRRFRHPLQKCRNFEVVCGDALLYELPEQPLVIYMFNPFGEELMRQLLERICDSLRQCPRQIVLIYQNPVWRDVVEETGCFRLIDVEVGGYPAAVYAATAEATPAAGATAGAMVAN